MLHLASKVFIILKILTYQCTTTEENHEDDEGFKVIMLHYGVASSAQIPPTLSPPLSDVQIQTWTSSHTVYHMEQNDQDNNYQRKSFEEISEVKL